MTQLRKRKSRGALERNVGLGLLILLVAFALVGNVAGSHDPFRQDIMSSLSPPSFGEHVLGSDNLGRDVWARMVSGARVTLTIGLSIIGISAVIGTLLGVVSGYRGGVVDTLIQKAVEVVWAFPPILLAIMITTMVGQSLTTLIVVLTMQRWIPFCRLARALTLQLRANDYITASENMGGGLVWVVRRHILPNVLPQMAIIASFAMAGAILAEASLSFLGLGVPPSIPTWGSMLSESKTYVYEAWWLVVFPGLGIFLTVFSLNFVGEWLEKAANPKD